MTGNSSHICAVIALRLLPADCGNLDCRSFNNNCFLSFYAAAELRVVKDLKTKLYSRSIHTSLFLPELDNVK